MDQLFTTSRRNIFFNSPYRALAKYDFNDSLNFEVREIEIVRIEDNSTIVTKTVESTDTANITDRFAGTANKNIEKEIKFGDDCFLFYSTDRNKCIQFLLNKISSAEGILHDARTALSNFRCNICKGGVDDV